MTLSLALTVIFLIIIVLLAGIALGFLAEALAHNHPRRSDIGASVWIISTVILAVAAALLMIR